MNALRTEAPPLVGSLKDIEELEKKSAGKILVISDSHGERELVEKIVTDFGVDCDALVFCGDGMADIAACLEEASRNEKLREALPPLVACARGNGDPEGFELGLAALEDEEGNTVPAATRLDAAPMVSFRLAGRNVMIAHGHRHQLYDCGTDMLHSVAESMSADLVFFGHRHYPHREDAGATLILNPGSCSYPRNGHPPTFAVVSFPGSTERYHTEFFEIKKTLFFGGWEFTPYHF